MHKSEKYKIYTMKTTKRMKEIKEGLCKWRHIPHSRIGKLNIVRISGLSNLIYIVNVIPFKIPASHLADIDKVVLVLIETQRP